MKKAHDSAKRAHALSTHNSTTIDKHINSTTDQLKELEKKRLQIMQNVHKIKARIQLVGRLRISIALLLSAPVCVISAFCFFPSLQVSNIFEVALRRNMTILLP
jgi:hypothetical protein